MFVPNVKIVKSPKGIVSSSVWFQFANHLQDIWSGPVYMFISDLRFEAIDVLSKGEFNSVNISLIKPNKVNCKRSRALLRL